MPQIRRASFQALGLAPPSSQLFQLAFFLIVMRLATTDGYPSLIHNLRRRSGALVASGSSTCMHGARILQLLVNIQLDREDLKSVGCTSHRANSTSITVTEITSATIHITHS